MKAYTDVFPAVDYVEEVRFTVYTDQDEWVFLVLAGDSCLVYWRHMGSPVSFDDVRLLPRNWTAFAR